MQMFSLYQGLPRHFVNELFLNILVVEIILLQLLIGAALQAIIPSCENIQHTKTKEV